MEANPSTPENNPISKKVKKLLEANYDQDKETLEALKGLSLISQENTLNNRRNLRSKIEKHSLSINEEFLKSFKTVKNFVENLHEEVNSMNTSCLDMLERIQKTRNETFDLLEQATLIKEESKRAQVIESLKLKPEEIIILRGSGSTGSISEEFDERFFKVLERVKKIHEDSKLLLKSDQHALGIEIMDSMTLHQEAAFERLYRWCLSVLRSINSDSLDVHPLICRALGCLQERSMLFKYSLDEYVTVRRAAVVRNFIDALTRGGPTGSPQPIELHSHNPIRYIGDILAWLHQAVASEKELMETLLKNCNQEELKNSNFIIESISSITEGLSRPLKVRVEQMLISDTSGKIKIGPVTHYRIKNLILFYLFTISQTLLSNSQLIYTLNELHMLSRRMFFNSINFYAGSRIAKGDIDIIPGDLRPSEYVSQMIKLVHEILSCQDSYLVSVGDRKEDIPEIISAVVEPVMKFSTIASSKLTAMEMAVYLTNCLNAIFETIQGYEHIESQLQMLQEQLNGHVESITNEQVFTIVSSLGMSSLHNAVLQQEDLRMPLSSMSGCDALAIQHFVKKLDTFLGSPSAFMIPLISSLTSEKIRENIWKSAVEMFCLAYEQVYNAVLNPSNKYQDSSGLFARKPDEVRILLL